jgi:anti-sigma B factor antagonist
VSLYLTPINIGEVTIIDVAGRITLGENTTAFRNVIRDQTAGGRRKILLNLADVTYIDSSGIGELISAYTTVQHLGGTVKLLNLTKRVYDLLHITKIYTVFEVFDDKGKAVRSFADHKAAGN